MPRRGRLAVPFVFAATVAPGIMAHHPDAAAMTNSHWTRLIRDIPDFPTPGIVFKDIMPVLADAAAFDDAIEALAAPWHGVRIDAVLAMEARGFLFGAPLARALGAGIVPLRKPGKLPAQSIGTDYALEYGSDRLEMHADAVSPGQRVLLVDDVLATVTQALARR